MRQQKSSRYFIYCEPCSYKKIYEEDSNDLTQIKVSPIPGGCPKLEKGKTVVKKSTKQLSKVKCPKCGRGVVLKPLPEVYAKSFADIEAKQQKAREEFERQKRIEDGTPLKPKPPEFIG